MMEGSVVFPFGKDSSTEESDPKLPPPEGDEDDVDVEDDFVPTVEFPPLIPLPPIVHFQSLHVDEESIFEVRAKLYCFGRLKKEEDGSSFGMWVERGLGVIKILQAKQTKIRVRVVMWKETANTIACNHWVSSIGSLTERTERFLQWSALDFAFESPREEIFLCKFRSPKDVRNSKLIIFTFK